MINYKPTNYKSEHKRPNWHLSVPDFDTDDTKDEHRN